MRNDWPAPHLLGSHSRCLRAAGVVRRHNGAPAARRGAYDSAAKQLSRPLARPVQLDAATTPARATHPTFRGLWRGTSPCRSARATITIAWADHQAAPSAPRRSPSGGAPHRAAPPSVRAAHCDCRSTAPRGARRREASALSAPCCHPGSPTPRAVERLSQPRFSRTPGLSHSCKRSTPAATLPPAIANA